MSTPDHALELLRAYRRAKIEHDIEGDRLRAESLTAIDAARAAGMPWDAIAEFLGHSNGHALRMWNRRERDSQLSADQAEQWWKEANL